MTSGPTRQGEPAEPTRSRTVSVILLGALCVFRAAVCLSRGLHHDEEQFIASGALLAREGLLPYIDYPYFHLPNLVFIFAALFKTNDFLLLTARSFNIVCACLLLVLIFGLIAFAFRGFGERRWYIALAITGLFAINPLFRFTVGRAWNHDLPVLASVAAFAALIGAAQSLHASKWLVAAGALLGIAAGTRLTFLPLFAPFLIVVMLFAAPGRARGRAAAVLVAAFLVAMLPTAWVFLRAPAEFIFGNFTYNGAVNREFRLSTKPASIALSNRILYPLTDIAKSPAYLLLVSGFVYFACWLPLRAGWRTLMQHREIAAVVVILPFILAAAFMPSPPYHQYYYAAVPFLVLGFAFGMARAWNNPADRTKPLRVTLAAVVIGAIGLIPSAPKTLLVLKPRDWGVWAVHRKAAEISRVAGEHRVLTLSPTYALEAGLRIYGELATGPFAWRVERFVKEEDRIRFRVLGPGNLDARLRDERPAILLGVANTDLERPLAQFARAHGYHRVAVGEHRSVWLPPQ